MKSFLDAIKLILRIFQNLCNVLGVYIILVFLSILILGLCDYAAWSELNVISYIKHAVGMQVIYWLLGALFAIILNAFIVMMIVKTFIKSYINSAKELKKDCWDNFTGAPANLIAKIIYKDGEIK
jgi:hypothetical protein